MSTHCGNAKKMSFFVKLLDVADVSSLNKTKNLQGRAEETFKSAIAFLLSSVMLNQVKCISGLSNLHLSKVFSVRYLFCGFSFLCLCFYVNDLYSNFTDPLQKQISIKQDTFWTNTHVKKGRRTWTANFDFAMTFDWLNNLFSFPIGPQGNFANKSYCY